MTDPHSRPETTEALIDDLEDLRDLLDDQIPLLSERAEPLADPALSDDEIPLITDEVAIERAAAEPESAPKSQPAPASPQKAATHNPFLPTEKLKQLAVERATIEKLFHEQMGETPHPDLGPQLEQLEQALRREAPLLIQQLTDELVEEALQEFSVRLENRLQLKFKELIDAQISSLLYPSQR